jgi:tol-pal system protein YbgF
MRKLALAVLACSVVSCASTSSQSDDSPAPVSSVAPVADNAQLTQMQTSMTEMLERLDVMNDRLTRMEEARSAEPAPVAYEPAPVAAPVMASAPAPVIHTQPAPVPAPVRETTSSSAASSRALASAQLADNYRAALVLYGKGRAKDARQAFQAVYDGDPTGELADNALFWIGETYFAAADYNNAMRFYRRVAVDFGDQNKAPDAMYKMGMAQARTGDLALARKTLEDVIAKYPYSTPAASARQELARIKY